MCRWESKCKKPRLVSSVGACWNRVKNADSLVTSEFWSPACSHSTDYDRSSTANNSKINWVFWGHIYSGYFNVKNSRRKHLSLSRLEGQTNSDLVIDQDFSNDGHWDGTRIRFSSEIDVFRFWLFRTLLSSHVFLEQCRNLTVDFLFVCVVMNWTVTILTKALNGECNRINADYKLKGDHGFNSSGSF